MPLQNRVTPKGELVAHPARGTMFGNRGGRFHDPLTKTLGARRWISRQWICCVLDFKGRRRDVFGRGYTELFFCDEVTALAAGHRPCFECRRADALAFAEAIMRHDRLPRRPTAPEIDAQLHAERLDGRAKRLHRLPFGSLPDGAMFLLNGAPHALREGTLWRWSFDGYEHTTIAINANALVETLTPPIVLGALRAGYAPKWHNIALQQ